MRKRQLLGMVFGRLTVSAEAPRTYQTMWACVCVCGKTCVVPAQHLVTGKTQSCGCRSDEVRAANARKRDYRGAKNPRAKKSAERNGGSYVPSSDVWYKRAAGVYYGARKKGVQVGFASVAELATYIQPLIPKQCPVFGVPFVERGAGFSKWSPSIDKIDPDKGYVRGNIQIISLFANCMKRDASAEELIKFATWVLQNDKTI